MPVTRRFHLPHPGSERYPGKILLTIALVVLAASVRHLVLPTDQVALSFVLFYPVVVFAGWLGGLFLGSFATCLSVAAVAFSIFQSADRTVGFDTGIGLGSNMVAWITLSALMLEGLVISLFAEYVLRRRDRDYQDLVLQLHRLFDEAPVATALKRAYEQQDAMRMQSGIDHALRVEAEDLVKAKDAFVANFSHELRTPLNALLGWTQLLARAPHDPERLKQALKAIEQSGALLAQLISDILDINRIASGKLQLNISRFSLASLIDKAIETVLPMAEGRGVIIEREREATGPLSGGSATLQISGDLVRLQQCLWNVLINAIKFTPRGGRVVVSTQTCGEQLKIIVSDTGQGIPKDALSRIFERFMQVDSAGSRSHGGLGLGLSIVKDLVELHGGAVSVESSGVGQGSTFTITLPLVSSVHSQASGA
jgi:signal transduction histidine kinase